MSVVSQAFRIDCDSPLEWTPDMAKKSRTPARAKPPIGVESHTHSTAKRVNIPTRETSAFATGDVNPAVLERDPSLDPQLVWKGKAGNLEVPVVAVHVQEKVHPRAIIEDLKAQAAGAKPKLVDLFSDFNGLDDFQKKLDFYAHEQHWTNRLILGDSLLVMTSLAEKERLRGRVQCIYFDPPYGIKFGSNWQVSTRKRDVKDANATDLTRQPEQIKAFRDTWELGIHSYLTYLRDRLTAARELLTESGSLFVQIGDENVHLVRCLMDEVFGSDNFCGLVAFKKTTGAGSFAGGTDVLSSVCDYLLWFAKSKEHVKYRRLYLEKEIGGVGGDQYTWLELPKGQRERVPAGGIARRAHEGRVFRGDNLTSQTTRVGQTTVFPVEFDEKTFIPNKGGWKTNQSGMAKLKAARRLLAQGNTLSYVRYFDDFPCFPFSNVWDDTVTSGFGESKLYVVQTNTKVIERCMLMTTDPGDLVLDPTCGSGTTAFVAEQWGRRWITIDTSRVALSLTRTRLMAAKFPYYLLADSPAGRKKQQQLGVPTPVVKTEASTVPDINCGFVYKTVPHVTLKSIANNPDIREGMSRAEIDAAIAKHADSETLYDQPYEDKSTVRVCGPFTVESLSPHREMPPVTGIVPSTDTPVKLDPGNYLRVIIDNLLEAGVKGSDKRERIALTRLDPFPGRYVHAEGATDKALGVRVSIGPELGTVGDQWLKSAALEAIQGSKPDLLLICAFAFEASVHQQTAELSKEIQFGSLRILPIRINPDLAMYGDKTGQELLKKTGSANLFTVFGEPDLKVTRLKDGQYTVTIRGLDVFDPTTGEVRESSTDDIACWFLDTDYDGQSFFVRQAYFCGATDPYERLKKALKAEIDEGEWAKLASTTSQPFQAPRGRTVAIKVINHFGDEILKVMTLEESKK